MISKGKDSPANHGGGLRWGPGWWPKLVVFLAPIALGLISLGEATDAIFLLNSARVAIVGAFSNQPEYDLIDKLNVGMTEQFANELAGQPSISRPIDDQTNAMFIHRGDYLLTLFISNQRLTAFTVVILDESFTPEFDLFTEDIFRFGEFSYSDIPMDATAYEFDDSNMARYYVESFDAGRAGRYVQSYIGNIDFGAGPVPEQLRSMYNAAIGGNSSVANAERDALRRASRPNLFGRGELRLEQIVDGLLTKSEFGVYFAR